MSQELNLGIRDRLRGRVSLLGPSLQEQMARFGARMVLFPGFFIRQEALLRYQQIMMNTLLDPVDRVREADALLFTIGLPYAEGGEQSAALWSVSWEGWRGVFRAYDELYASQRKWYRDEVMLNVAEFLPSHHVETNDDGTSKVVTRYERIERQVREGTYDAIRIVDSIQSQDPHRPADWRPAQLVGRSEVKADAKYERLRAMVGYDELAAESSIRIASGQVVEWAGDVLNRSFNAKNTPGQAETIFMGTNPNNQMANRYGIEEAASIGKPKGKGRTGVHQA